MGRPAEDLTHRVPEPKPKTLAVHSGALGDLVLFGRLLRGLPGPVTLVAGGSKGALLVGLGAVERALDFDALAIHEIFSDTPQAQCSLPVMLGGCDRLISCFAAGNPAAEQRLAALCDIRPGDAHFLPIRPGSDWSGHLMDLWRRRLADGGVCCGRADPPLVVPGQWRRDAAEALRPLGLNPDRPFLAIHPGAGAAAKCWPLNAFIELARLLPGGKGPACAREVLFVIGPAESERWPQRDVAALGRSWPVLESPALTVLAGTLSLARCAVGNDSGVSHLAAAVGTPTLALFGPTRPEHFAPLGPRVSVLAGHSLADIRPQEVLRVLRELVDGP